MSAVVQILYQFYYQVVWAWFQSKYLLVGNLQSIFYEYLQTIIICFKFRTGCGTGRIFGKPANLTGTSTEEHEKIIQCVCVCSDRQCGPLATVGGYKILGCYSSILLGNNTLLQFLQLHPIQQQSLFNRELVQGNAQVFDNDIVRLNQTQNFGIALIFNFTWSSFADSISVIRIVAFTPSFQQGNQYMIYAYKSYLIMMVIFVSIFRLVVLVKNKITAFLAKLVFIVTLLNLNQQLMLQIEKN
eukprot:TRINITY_DN23054_c0_g2_i1.p1 TRINITY_DN23054_c0_g2~~TRINITY_DN23054_c0_g2_i1.p1  ORF type:complete len:243 (-),score=-3.37 TRINITY_DN23054_c0_g2_i1:97-825(-)